MRFFKIQIFLVAILSILLIGCIYSEQNTAGATTTIEIVDSVINLGQIKFGVATNCEFNIKNTGNKPLLLFSVEPSCGCTKANWTRKPVRKGNSATITIEFDGKAFGNFSKSIEVQLNTAEGRKTLRFIGEVVE